MSRDWSDTAHAVRCQALEMLGYTPRQAQFLVLVSLHGGYFLRRQYVAFTGTPHGQAAVRFLAHAVAREHVRVLPDGRQGHVFPPVRPTALRGDRRGGQPQPPPGGMGRARDSWRRRRKRLRSCVSDRFRPSCPSGVTHPGVPVAARRLATSWRRCRGTRKARMTASGSPTCMPSAHCRASRRSSNKQFMQTSSISSTDVDAAAFPPCLLRVHALSRRYDPERATETRTATERG